MEESIRTGINPEQISFLCCNEANNPHPAIAEAADAIKRLYSNMNEVGKNANEAVLPSENEKKAAEIYAQDGQRVSLAAAAFYRQTARGEDILDFTRRQIGRFIDPQTVKYLGMDVTTAETIRLIDSHLKDVEVFGENIKPNLKNLMTDDSHTGFSLMQAFAVPLGEHKIDRPDTTIIEMASIEHFLDTRQDESLIEHAVRQLKDGQFDGLVAAELIDEIERPASDPAIESRRIDVRNMLGLLMLGGADESQARQYLSTDQGLAYWGTRLKAGLDARKSQYTELIDKRLNERRRYINEFCLILPKDGAEAFEKEISLYVSRMTGVLNGSFQSGRMHSHAKASDVNRQRMMLRATARRANRGYSGNGDTRRPPEISPLLRERPRELRFINGQGELYQPAEGAVADCVADYVKRHGGNDQHLTEDLYGFFEELQLIDLSKDIHKGVIPHNRDVKINGVNIGTLWQIRPDKIISHINLGQHAKKLRIFCTLDNDVLGIFRLVNKNDVHNFKRGMGIEGAVRGNK